MLKALLSTRIAAIYSKMFNRSNQSKKRGTGFKILIGFFTIYIIAYFAIIFGFLFNSLCNPLADAGLSWFYFALMGIMVAAIGFVGSIFTTQTQLFEANDNELLLSLPIPPKVILVSRMGVLLLMNYLYEAFIVIPAAVVYCMNQKVTLVGALYFVICIILLPLLILAISCLFGWLLALISTKLPFKNAIIMVLSLGFLIGYLVFFSRIQSYIGMLVTKGETIAAAVKKAVFPAYHMGVAIADQSFVSLLLFALCAIIPFLLVYVCLSYNFIKIATTNKGNIKVKYKEKALKVSSAKNAFIKKELKHFISNPMYMLNAGIGIAFMIVLAGMLVYKREFIMSSIVTIPNMESILAPMMTVFLCYCATMNFISAPSISLEGKNLWIARSLPVDSGDILLSKAEAHMAACLPAVVISATIINFALPSTPLQMILMYLLPAVTTVFTALLGVVINLHFPKFDWISETIAIKQGVSSLIAMFGSMAILGIPTVLYIAVLNSYISMVVYLVICTVVFAGLSYGLNRYLKTKGKEIFERL